MKKNVFLILILLQALFSTNCSKLEGNYDPGFNKMNFNLNYKQQEIETKAKSMNWSIKGLRIDNSKELVFFSNPDNAKEMELDGITFKIAYEIESLNQETGVISYTNPNKIACQCFEIEKTSNCKLKIKLEENVTGKERLLRIHVGDGNYYGWIEITQSAKPN